MKMEDNDYAPNPMHSAATADRKEEARSEYQRNRFEPIGQSVDGHIRKEGTEIDPSKDDFRSRTKYDGKSNDEKSDFASAHFREDKQQYN